MGLPCEICDSNENDEGIFGEMGTQSRHVLHRNCLVLSMGKFVQNQQPDYRFFNYLRHDFLAEKSRFSMVRCSYCSRRGANLSCCHTGCTCSFHTKCGVANLAVLQYGGKFDCFCAEHVPQRSANRPKTEDHCVICLDLVVPEGEEFRPALAFQGPCCRSGWFHRDCVQNHANATAQFFKCPLCRDEPKFAEVAMFGVSIPKWRYGLPHPPANWNMRESRDIIRGRSPRVRVDRLGFSLGFLSGSRPGEDQEDR